MWKKEWYYFNVLVRRLLIVLALFMICRLIFFLFNKDLFPELGVNEFFLASLVGLRYDLAAVLIINSVFILLHLVPNPWRNTRRYQRFLKWQFYLINGGFLFLEAADFVYFRYGSVRTSSHLLGLRYDIIHLIPQFIRDFWYLLLLVVALFFVVEWFYRKTSVRKRHHPVSALIIIGSTLLLAFGLAPLLAHGGSLQEKKGKSERVTQAVEWPLITNTTFTVIESFVRRYLKSPDYLSPADAERIYPFKRIMKAHSPLTAAFDRPERPNIVVILLESFSSEYIGFFNDGRGYTPFLDSLFRHSLVFENAYANGKHSIDAIASITAGLPPLMPDPFISSPYSSNEIDGMGDYLKKVSYHSYFFHGARSNTMQLDKFLPKAGFDEFFGMEKYGNEADFDGNWGIFDGPFLSFTADVMDTLPSPFAAVIFTLSSHHPFTLPDDYRPLADPEASDLLKTISYADHSLQQFFQKASKMEWFDNTVFILTADHTGPAISDAYKNPAGMFDIPIAIFDPRLSSGLRSGKVVQQSDILPTVLELAGYTGPYTCIGDPLFSNEGGFSVSYLNGIYQIITAGFLLQFDGEQVLGLYDPDKDPLLENDLSDDFPGVRLELEWKLKAILQQYIDAMLNNKLAG